MAMAISVPLYTVDDLEHFPDDGNRYELLDGRADAENATTAGHPCLSRTLQSYYGLAKDHRALAGSRSPQPVIAGL